MPRRRRELDPTALRLGGRGLPCSLCLEQQTLACLADEKNAATERAGLRTRAAGVRGAGQGSRRQTRAVRETRIARRQRARATLAPRGRCDTNCCLARRFATLGAAVERGSECIYKGSRGVERAHGGRVAARSVSPFFPLHALCLHLSPLFPPEPVFASAVGARTAKAKPLARAIEEESNVYARASGRGAGERVHPPLRRPAEPEDSLTRSSAPTPLRSARSSRPPLPLFPRPPPRAARARAREKPTARPGRASALVDGAQRRLDAGAIATIAQASR